MKQHLQHIAARAPAGLRVAGKLAAAWVPDGLMAAGAGGIAYGAGLVYVPAGYIVGGGFVLVAGVLAARKKGV